jgi:hypothetical protein
MTGITILTFTAIEGNNGYIMFAWIYGIFYGGYSYALKMYINEKVRARNFARAWGFAQFSMAAPSLIGIPFSGILEKMIKLIIQFCRPADVAEAIEHLPFSNITKVFNLP